MLFFLRVLLAFLYLHLGQSLPLVLWLIVSCHSCPQFPIHHIVLPEPGVKCSGSNTSFLEGCHSWESSGNKWHKDSSNLTDFLSEYNLLNSSVAAQLSLPKYPRMWLEVSRDKVFFSRMILSIFLIIWWYLLGCLYHCRF